MPDALDTRAALRALAMIVRDIQLGVSSGVIYTHGLWRERLS